MLLREPTLALCLGDFISLLPVKIWWEGFSKIKLSGVFFLS